jgi:hypothetical protein
MDQYNTDLLDEQLNIIFYKQIYCSATKFVKLKAREEKRARKILVLILKIKLRILLINNKKNKNNSCFALNFCLDLHQQDMTKY